MSHGLDRARDRGVDRRAGLAGVVRGKARRTTIPDEAADRLEARVGDEALERTLPSCLEGLDVPASKAQRTVLDGLSLSIGGGVTGLEDIDKLLAVEHEGIDGVILGRSLYEGTLDFAAALELAANVPHAN